MENVNVLIQDLRGQAINLEAYTAISKEQIPTMIPNGMILESETKRSENGDFFHRIIFSGLQNEVPLTFLQYYFIHDEQAFVLTLTCEQTQFEAYKAVGENVLASFHFKN